jgi:hypothetical protein
MYIPSIGYCYLLAAALVYAWDRAGGATLQAPTAAKSEDPQTLYVEAVCAATVWIGPNTRHIARDAFNKQDTPRLICSFIGGSMVYIL